MPQNLELKARISSVTAAEKTAAALPAMDAGILRQKDTYFLVPSGRLKLRETEGRDAELIFYDRPESALERWSTYSIYPARDPEKLLVVLEAAFPVKGVVEKERKLFLYENARIHLDAVKNLGSFIEFEVIVGASAPRAEELMTELRAAFSITDASVIRCSYIDFF